MKKISFLVVPLLLVSFTHAALLPASSYYNGQASRSFDLAEGTLDLRLEFSVYRSTDTFQLQDGTPTNEAQLIQDWTGHTGNSDYVYAYQVYCENSSTAALTYFALTGINPATIASIENDIHEQEALDTFSSNGVQPKGDGGYFNDSVTKAIWEFEDGALAQGDQSWFLFLYSDYDWIAGDIEVQPANDDIPVPEVPEPATLVLLGCGAILSLVRKK